MVTVLNRLRGVRGFVAKVNYGALNLWKMDGRIRKFGMDLCKI